MKDENHVDLNEDENTVTSHSFDFPTEMCGRLIGQRGRNVAVIKEKSGVEIMIRAKRYDTSWQIVTLEGETVYKALTDDSFVSHCNYILGKEIGDTSVSTDDHCANAS